MSANLDFVRSLYTDWERGDFSRGDWADPQIEFDVIGSVEAREPTKGLAGMAQGFRDFLSTWTDYRLKVDECRELDGERVLVLYHATSGRAKTSGMDVRWMQTNGATLLHIRDGKVTRLVVYPYADRAFSDLDLTPEADSPRDREGSSSGLFTRQVGQGPRIVLLHGGVSVGEFTWREQLPLAERFTLVIVERAGYGRSDSISAGEDLDADGRLVPELLEDGAHLVGQSSGAVAAMLAAAQRPEAVLSLTLSEPVAFQLLPDSAGAQRIAHDLDAHLGASGDDARWLRRFAHIVGGDARVPDQLPPALAAGVKAVRAVRRRPWDGELPLDELARATFPKLVISGDHNPVFEALCDQLADRLHAERAHVPGAGHTTPHAGRPFNDTLEAFIGGSARQQR